MTKGWMEIAFDFDIEKHITVLQEESNGWRKELNMVSWNSRDAKFDIRSWSEDHSKMSKGITLTKEEAEKLVLGLQNELEEL